VFVSPLRVALSKATGVSRLYAAEQAESFELARNLKIAVSAVCCCLVPGAVPHHRMIFSNVRPGSIIIAKPYRFVPPYRGTFWTTLLQPLGRTLPRRLSAVTRVDVRAV